jgi:hypothetical protein
MAAMKMKSKLTVMMGSVFVFSSVYQSLGLTANECSSQDQNSIWQSSTDAHNNAQDELLASGIFSSVVEG